MSEHIVVPLDGSSAARAALPYAATLAKRLGAGIHLVEVLVDTPRVPVGARVGAGGDGDSTLALPKQAETETRLANAYLRWVADEVEMAGVPATYEVAHGPVAEALLNVAQREGVSLVAMTTHSRSSLARLVVGSVASRVIRESERPVLLVRRREPNDCEPEAEGWLKPEGRAARVLVPLDGSPLAECVLPTITRFAERLDLEVVLLRVAMWTANESPSWGVYHMADQAEARAYLATVEANLAGKGIAVRTATGWGEPARTIVKTAEQEGCDLIAMSTHGRTGFLQLVLGSVTESVLQLSPVPVLVVRGKAGGG